MSDSQKSNLEPDFKQVLKYLHQIIDGIDGLIREFKLFNYPDNEPSGGENNNVIPIRELHKESDKNDD